MAILAIARKDWRLLLRDARSAIILLVMPLVFVFVLGLTVGDRFGQSTDDRVRISVVNLDQGLPANTVGAPPKPWSEIVIDDLSTIGGLRIEIIATREEAESLLARNRRAAVLIFEPDFSTRMQACSFLTVTTPPPVNPLSRDGIDAARLGLTVKKDASQAVSAAIIEQAAQVTLLRTVVPWMIGRAFEKVGDSFGGFVRRGISDLFSNYDFTAKTWAGLTSNRQYLSKGTMTARAFAYMQHRAAAKQPAERGSYVAEPEGLLNRGAMRYRILVPSYTVMFQFFLVLTVGWMFTAERRQNTLVRLRAAPIRRSDILLGKLLPCLALSLAQGLFLFGAGWAIFGMTWGNRPELVVCVIAATSLAAMGLAMLNAGRARTEAQVAVYGTLLVLTLAGISGTLMPRDLMPEAMRQLSYITPHAWALDAYSHLLNEPTPDVGRVLHDCGVLGLFGLGFLGLAWASLRLD